MPYTILTDTSANLPTPLLRQYDIAVLPFQYFIEGEAHTCQDTEQFDDKAYYGMIRRGVRVTTSQITPQTYADVMTPFLEQGNDILFIGMSSGISGSFHCAEIASEELREQYPRRVIRLVDTKGASLGEGLHALWAAQQRAKGMSLEQVTDALEKRCRETYQSFTVDDLMHLRRSGRLSNAAAVIGTVLGIKPILKGDEEGRIVACAKVRGRKQSIRAIAEKYRTLVRHPEAQTVGIAHADCPEDAETLAEMIRQIAPPKEILTVKYEPVTGSHVGPGALALFFLGDEQVRGC